MFVTTLRSRSAKGLGGLPCLQVRYPAPRVGMTIWLTYPSLLQLYPFTVWYPKRHPLQGNAEQNDNGREQCLKQPRETGIQDFSLVGDSPFHQNIFLSSPACTFCSLLNPLFLAWWPKPAKPSVGGVGNGRRQSKVIFPLPVSVSNHYLQSVKNQIISFADSLVSFRNNLNAVHCADLGIKMLTGSRSLRIQMHT